MPAHPSRPRWLLCRGNQEHLINAPRKLIRTMSCASAAKQGQGSLHGSDCPWGLWCDIHTQNKGALICRQPAVCPKFSGVPKASPTPAPQPCRDPAPGREHSLPGAGQSHHRSGPEGPGQAVSMRSENASAEGEAGRRAEGAGPCQRLPGGVPLALAVPSWGPGRLHCKMGTQLPGRL